MKDLDRHVRDIAERIASLVREAYQRGESDALERVVRLARSNPNQSGVSTIDIIARAEHATRKGRKRAPKGAVEVLVGRALGNGSGKTPDEIKAYAATDYEEMVAVPSIRSHLRAGEKKGRYRKQGHRWYAIHGSAGSATLQLEEPKVDAN
jgi:hypothetical protein